MENKELNEVLESLAASLTEEQKDKVKACKSAEELMELAAKEGIELPEATLDKIAGGIYSRPMSEIPRSPVL